MEERERKSNEKEMMLHESESSFLSREGKIRDFEKLIHPLEGPSSFLPSLPFLSFSPPLPSFYFHEKLAFDL